MGSLLTERMRKHHLLLACLILLFCWPLQAQEQIASADIPALVPERLKLVFEEHYLDQLSAAGRNLNLQGLYVESLDGSAILADQNSDTPFNPASVIKIATTFAALDRLGADYVFETSFLAAGTIDKKTSTLKGDLVLSSAGDPTLTSRDITNLIAQVKKAGITKVTGSLVTTGKFTYGSYQVTATAVRNLEKAFRTQGVRIAKPTKKGAAKGTPVARKLSQTLREIVFHQNAYSDNAIADRLGEAIGGPKAVEAFLEDGIGIPAGDVDVTHASGLGFNRITARGTVQLLRNLVLWLNLRNLLPQDILPVAGQDVGTLAKRFTSSDYRGSVIGKTGTLPNTDGGVSTLAGFVYTRDRGVLVFAIFNNKGNVNAARQLQDSLLQELIVESGGAELSASLRKSDN
jgi:D-alanyl-D-alanine carboxypeptidase/D-alanyl-D-alanine-endopeptidase (penicillin-binding protein 4)